MKKCIDCISPILQQPSSSFCIRLLLSSFLALLIIAHVTESDLPQILNYARIYIYYFFHSFQFVVNNLGNDSAIVNNDGGHATAQFATFVSLVVFVLCWPIKLRSNARKVDVNKGPPTKRTYFSDTEYFRLKWFLLITDVYVCIKYIGNVCIKSKEI